MLSTEYIDKGSPAHYYEVVTRENLEDDDPSQDQGYTGNAGIWTAKKSHYLRLSRQSLTREDFFKLITGCSPNKQQPLKPNGKKNHRAGIEWPFQVPKSIHLDLGKNSNDDNIDF